MDGSMHAGDDIDRRHGTNRKIISESSMSSPKTQYDKVTSWPPGGTVGYTVNAHACI